MIPQISSSIAQAQGRISLVGIGRRATRSAKFFGAAAVVALLAPNLGFANATVNPSRMAQEQHACSVILGLDPSSSLYDTCIRSLHQSLAAWNQAQAVQTDRRVCAEKGLEPGTAAFAVCVVEAQ